MARRLRSAVVGAGRIADEHLRFLAGSELARLEAVCDLSPALARLAARRFGAARSYSDVGELLAEVRPDVVHVLTPPHTHVRLCEEALEAGAHVVVEKPATPTRDELGKLLERAARRGLRLVEDQNCRFSAGVRALEGLLADGRLGELREAEIRLSLGLTSPGGRYADRNLRHPSHSLPAGALHEFLPHLTYLAVGFLPGYDRVVAGWRKVGDHPFFRHDELDALVLDGDRSARLRLTTSQAPDAFLVRVHGSRGWAECDLYHPYLRRVHADRRLAPVANHLAGGLALGRAAFGVLRDKLLQRTLYENVQVFLRLTYEALRKGEAPPVSALDMERSARLIDELLRPESQV